MQKYARIFFTSTIQSSKEFVCTSDDLDLDSCHDVAIIGAGSGGASVLWKLRDDGLKVAIYEQLHRIGGKTGH